jgi:hypothetical protein
VVRSRTIDQTAIVQFYSIWGADKVVVEIDNTTSYQKDSLQSTGDSVTAVAPSLFGRNRDHEPWLGGDKITLAYARFNQNVVTTCTSGFGVFGPGAYGNGSRYGTTAGHCSGGDTPRTICQNVTCGAAYGTPHTVVYYFGGYGDEASFANNSYPAVYTDSVTKKSQTQLVKAYTLQPGLGDGYARTDRRQKSAAAVVLKTATSTVLSTPRTESSFAAR